MSDGEDTYLDLECSEDEDESEPFMEEINLKKGSDKSRKAASTTTSGPAICGFCHKPSTLKIGGKSYLCSSRTMPHLRICNACKSYEYRHGILIDRDQRKNKSRKRRIDSDGPSRKRQYYDPVEENPQEIESEPELYPFARTDTPAKKIRTLPKPPASVLQMRYSANAETIRVPTNFGGFTTPPKRVVRPRRSRTIKREEKTDDFYLPRSVKPAVVKKNPFPPLDDSEEEERMDMDIDIEGDSDNDDLGCDLCKKPIKEVSQLIMCGGCDKIFHKDCYALVKTDYTILRPNYFGCRSVTITCADHKFMEEASHVSFGGKPPRSLSPLTIIDTKEPTKPTLTLSDLCFDSIDETNVVITPEYVNQCFLKEKHQITGGCEEGLQKHDQQNLNMINPFLFGVF